MSGGRDMLYGWDGLDKVTAFHAYETETGTYLRAYIRDGDGVRTDEKPFMPFLLVAREEFIPHLPEANVTTLDGSLDFKWKAEFKTLKDLERAKKKIDAEFRSKLKRPADEYLYISYPVEQGLVATGAVHYRNMAEDDVVRMQLDIETFTEEGFAFPNAEREADEIIIVAMSDSTGRGLTLSRLDYTEAGLISELSRIVGEWNPDVIEGHNIFRFDLPYIEARAKRHGIKLAWGRDGSVVSKRKSRVNLAERRFDYVRYEAVGRTIVDSYILVQFYDLVKREMESYSLKEVAKYLGIAADDRTYIEGKKIRDAWIQSPDELLKYALDDVRETRAITSMLVAPYFYQAQMLPLSYQDIFVRGGATKINALLLRWYLKNNHSIPKPKHREGDVVGGFTEARVAGILKDVVLCDVASLYPSLMLSMAIEPAADTMGAFLSMLSELKDQRLSAKSSQKTEKNETARRRLENQQATFKILINSFFGYLGADGAYFGDADAANKVTGAGQETLKRMMAWLEKEGCRIVEVDTDGVFFQPPEDCTGDADVEALVARLSETLPAGINVEIDGRFPAMLSYKVKNYALLKPDGGVIIKGSGLKSRGLEPFQRDFIGAGIRAILAGQPEQIDLLFTELRRKITELALPVEHLSKTDRLQDPLAVYAGKVSKSGRGRQAGYELALASGREYQPGDYVSYYVTGEKPNVPVWKNAKMLEEFDPAAPDVNIPYYLSKLDDVYERVKGFVPS